MLCSGPFRIDLADERLWRDEQPISLRPKSWAVLRHLVERAGRLVTKEELIDAVWPDTAVEEKVLNASIGEIRRALGDSARAPRFVATVARRGFRFIAPLTGAEPAAAGAVAAAAPPGPVVTPVDQAVQAPQRSAFIGRDAELSGLVAARAALRSGRGGIALIGGTAGVGKSRLVAELLARVGDAEAEVLIGHCLEGGAIPYWPWVEMINGALRAAEPALVRERCADVAAELTRIVPTFATRAGGETPVATTDPELARLRLFDAIGSFFERLAPEGGLILVIEDLHWADADSLRALQALSARLVERPTLLLVTVRDDEVEATSVVTEVLGALRRHPATRWWQLAGLAGPSARLLVDALGRGGVPAAVVGQIVSATQGNPFFIEEVLRHLDELSLLDREHGWRSRLLAQHLDLPASVVEVFDRRLRRLSAGCRRLLDVAAIAGTEADEMLLARALGSDVESIAGSAAEAIAAGVLEESAQCPGSYRFGHALMRAVLQQRQPGPLRRRAHLRVAEALEAVHGVDDRTLPEIAFHLAQAVPAADVRRALDFTVRAAERAGALLAYESEAEHYQRALALVAADRNAGQALHAEIAVRHAEAVQRTGDAAAARLHFGEAAELARGAGTPQWLARAVLGMTTIWEFDDPEVRALLEDALARLGDADGELHTRVRARLAVVLYPLDGTRARCEALSSEALAHARASGDPTLLAQTLVDWLAGQWYPDNLATQRAITDELLAVAQRSGDPALRATAHGWHAVIGMCSGEFARAHDEVDALVALAGELAQPLYRWCGGYLAATLALLRGELGPADRLSSDAFALGQRCSPNAARQVFAGQLLALRREQDRAAEVLPLMQRDDYGAADIASWTLPHVLLEADRVAEAGVAFERACAHGFAAMPGDNSRNRGLIVLGAMALACAALRDTRRAAELYERITPHAERWSVSSFGNVCFGLMGNGAGALASCLGRWDAATRHFEHAVAEHGRVGARVALARSYHLYAEMLLERGRRTDQSRAAQLIEHASALSREHGLARVAKLLARLPQTNR